MNNLRDPFNRHSPLGTLGLGNRAFPQQFNPALRILQGGAQQLREKVLIEGAKAIESGVQAIESGKQAVEQAVAAGSGLFDSSAERNTDPLSPTGEEHLGRFESSGLLSRESDKVKEKEREKEERLREKEEGRPRKTEDMSSFAVPKNVPSFTNPQRELENRVWGSSGTTHSRANGGHARDHRYGNEKGMMGGLQTHVGGFFEQAGKNDLPMYKDKPYSYASSRRQRPLWKRRRVLGVGALLFFAILWFLGVFGGGDSESGKIPSSFLRGGKGKDGKDLVDWSERQDRVRDAFKLSWDSYERYAWGMLCFSVRDWLYLHTNNCFYRQR